MRESDCVSFGWCFWHWTCYGCLFYGNGKLCTGERHLAGEGDTGPCQGRIEVSEPPLCFNCFAECRADELNEDDVIRMGLRRINAADGGLTSRRWVGKTKPAPWGSAGVEVRWLRPKMMGGEGKGTAGCLLTLRDTGHSVSGRKGNGRHWENRGRRQLLGEHQRPCPRMLVSTSPTETIPISSRAPFPATRLPLVTASREGSPRKANQCSRRRGAGLPEVGEGGQAAAGASIRYCSCCRHQNVWSAPRCLSRIRVKIQPQKLHSSSPRRGAASTSQIATSFRAVRGVSSRSGRTAPHGPSIRDPADEWFRMWKTLSGDQ